MVINFITHYSSPTGTYFRWHNLAIGLSMLGYQVRVFASDANTRARDREEIRDGISYRIVQSSPGRRFFGSANHPLDALKRATVDYPRADIVHMFQPFLSGLLLWRRQALCSHAVSWYDWDDLWTGGGFFGSYRQSRGFSGKWNYFSTSALERRLPSMAMRVTTCSSWLSRLAQKRGARNPFIVRNGFWPLPAAEPESARHALGLDKKALYCGFMGRTMTGEELNWCLDGLREFCHSGSNLRLAVCGINPNTVPLDATLRAHVDLLGVIDPPQAHLFASAMDLGLVPLEDHPFNWSRFPIRFAHFLGARTPVLCSEIGDLSEFSTVPGVLPAGEGRSAWLAAFRSAIGGIETGNIPSLDSSVAESIFSWGVISTQLERHYLKSL